MKLRRAQRTELQKAGDCPGTRLSRATWFEINCNILINYSCHGIWELSGSVRYQGFSHWNLRDPASIYTLKFYWKTTRGPAVIECMRCMLAISWNTVRDRVLHTSQHCTHARFLRFLTTKLELSQLGVGLVTVTNVNAGGITGKEGLQAK